MKSQSSELLLIKPLNCKCTTLGSLAPGMNFKSYRIIINFYNLNDKSKYSIIEKL